MSNKRIEIAKKNIKRKINNKNSAINKKKAEKTSNTKTTTPRIKKSKKNRIIKVLLILFFTACILGLFAVGLFFGYIIIKSPEFNPEALYDKQPSIFIAKDGKTEYARVGSEIRDIISYDQLPEVLVNAVVATEDSRFFQHNGFDFPRFFKASIQQVLGKHDAGGASTLTMQISKNKLTNTVDKGIQGIIRKFTDIYLSVFKIEKTYTKKEIIEFYMNASYLGADANGVEDASKAYFRKSAKDLNLAEAAMIAGLFNAPGYYDPYINPDGCEQRRQTVLYLMKRHGYITEDEYNIALKMTVNKILMPKQDDKGTEYQGFINTVVDEVIDKTGLNPYEVAMRIYTTVDLEQQAYMEKLMNGEIDSYKWENDVVQGGIAVINVQDGSISSVGAGRNRKARDFNYATDIKAQIGSTAKPLYDYSIGIEKLDWSTYQCFGDEPWGYENGTIQIKNWDSKYHGLTTIRTALIESYNIPAVKAFQSTDNQSKIDWVKSMGLHPEIENGVLHEAHALGGYNGESPLSLAAAYNTFANKGYYIEPYSVTRIEFLDIDREPYEYKYKMTKVMSEETAYLMTNLLISVAKGSGFAGQYVNGLTYAAKSGTTNLDKETLAAWNLPSKAVDAIWAVGYTDKYTIAAWYGYDHMSSTYYNTFGSQQNYRIWAAAARGVLKESAHFDMPSGVVRVELESELCGAELPSEFTPNDLRVVEYFKKGSEPTKVSDRFSKLSNVTNLKASKSSDSSKVTLTWNPIKTPNAISLDYQLSYYGSIYHNADVAASDANGRYNVNKNLLGDIVYKIYEYDEDAENDSKYTLVATTDKSQITLTPTTSSVTYVVKTSYTNFTANISDGVLINVDNIKPVKPSTGGSTGGSTGSGNTSGEGNSGNTGSSSSTTTE